MVGEVVLPAAANFTNLIIHQNYKKMEQKEFKREVVDYIYVAVDGAEFSNKDQCVEYEKSARCAVEARYHQLVVKKLTEYDILHFGCDENVVEVVEIKDDNDKEIVTRLYAHINGYQRSNEYVQNFYNRLETGKVFIDRGYDYEDIWYIGSLEKIFSDIKKAAEV